MEETLNASETVMASAISSLSQITGHYDVILCDVWGVLHNGIDPFIPAGKILAQARQQGISVVLITNSPRLRGDVAQQLDLIGVNRDAYDAIVTSGDVTATLIGQLRKPVFFLGPERDKTLLSGLNVVCVDRTQAEAIVCTGFFDDESETVEDYRELLEGFAARQLPFICANPDLVVERGEKLIPCAGAMAAFYEELGGTTFIAGKPHHPIYTAAIAQALALRGEIDRARILAIGDGMPTDIRGAVDQGLDVLYVSGGIHANHYTKGGQTDEAALQQFFTTHGVDPRWWIGRLG